MPKYPPVYFSSLEIEDVRCFGGRQILDLTDNGRAKQWSLLIGENGAGKTTLLQCLAWMRPVPEDTSKGVPITSDTTHPRGIPPLSRGMLKPALTGEENVVLETLPRIRSNRVHLSATLSFGRGSIWQEEISNGPPIKPKNIRLGVELSFDDHSLLLDWKLRRSRIQNLGTQFHDPLIVSYGSNRGLAERNLIRIDDLAPLDYDRLARKTELCDVDEVLVNLDHAALRDPSSREKSTLDRLKDVIARILPDNRGPECVQIYPRDVLEEGQRSGTHIDTFTGLVRMSALSLGYRTTMGWAIDLAWRLVHRYPDSPDPLAEPAVVLIDEIDLHLHPRWQVRVIKDLSSLFPATQFIATSHSPLMVQTAEEANLILLRKGENNVEIINDLGIPRNLRVDQILTSLLFGLHSSRSESVQNLFTERAELTQRTGLSQEEEQRLNEIQRQLSELPIGRNSEDDEAMDLIRSFANDLRTQEEIKR